jgi:integrase
MSNRTRLTEAAIKRTLPGSAVRFLRDNQLIGFGLRITPNGAKSFIAEGRVNGRMRRFTIGPVERFSASEARLRARTLLAEMHDGKDPQAKRRAARQRSGTLAAMLDDYIDAKGVKETTADKYRAQMSRNLTDWVEKPIDEITPQMVRLRYEAILKRSVSEANGTMRALRAVCRRAINILPDREDGTPMMKIVPTVSLAGEWRALDRKTSVLDPHELRPWWHALQGLRSNESRRALQALLLTGLRVSELLSLLWEDVDLSHQKLAISASKTGRFEKFIGPELNARIADWRKEDCKNRIFHVDDLRGALDQVVKLGGKRVTPHDLRRTFLTFGERAGAPLVTLKMLVNHSTKGDVTSGYIRPSEADLRHWADVIETSILNAAEAGPEVTKLAGRRAR